MRIIIIFLFVAGTELVFAQTYNMKIKQNAGSTFSEISTIDEISFLNVATNPFVCGDVILYGGETYPTVQIGTQCWFQKNLNIGTRIDGPTNQTNNSVTEKYCYDDKPENCVSYGGLYQWNEAMQYVTTEGAKGICPTGWHIPTNTENEACSNEVFGDGNKLKAFGQGTGDGAGTNQSRFSAFVTGSRHIIGAFENFANYVFFWSSSQDGSRGYTLWLTDSISNIYLFGYNKDYGFNVRCVKD